MELIENTGLFRAIVGGSEKNKLFFRAQIDGVGLSSQDEVIILSLKNFISHSLVTILSEECVINDSGEI
jgi:hypothetical protein